MSTVLSNTIVPAATQEERAERIIAAGNFWADHIAADVSHATLSFSASGIAEGSVASRIRAGKHEFVIDEPAGLAGSDSGASPVEVALGALIACHIVVYRVYAQGMNIKIDEISAEANGTLDVRGLFGFDDSVRPGFQAITVDVTVSGPETADRYAQLHAAVEAHCPVLDLFSNTTPVTTTLTVS